VYVSRLLLSYYNLAIKKPGKIAKIQAIKIISVADPDPGSGAFLTPCPNL
jgi:hypothetical protein